MRSLVSPLIIVTMLVSVSAFSSHAGQPPAPPGPEKEHAMLKNFVGEWETVSECRMGPDQPAVRCTGTLKARMLGEFWVLCEYTGSMGDMHVNALQTIGYNPEKKSYVGTWVDSTTNYMWQYQGTVQNQVLTLEAEGPAFAAGGGKSLFRDIYDFSTPNQIGMTSQMQTEDGTWVTFMTGTARPKVVKP